MPKPRISNRLFWDLRSGRYPYKAKAPKLKPRPEDAIKAGFSLFIACPVENDSLVWWGFPTEEERDKFRKLFPESTEFKLDDNT